MIQKARYRISFAERTSTGKLILAQQPKISFAAALAQVQRLKKISTTEALIKEGQAATLTNYISENHLCVDKPSEAEE